MIKKYEKGGLDGLDGHGQGGIDETGKRESIEGGGDISRCTQQSARVGVFIKEIRGTRFWCRVLQVPRKGKGETHHIL